MTYTVRVTNNGPDAATGVVVSDVIPSGLTLQSATPSDGVYSTGTGNWTLASPLAPGASATLTLVTVLDAREVDSAITNTVSVVASDQADPDAGNDSGLVTVAGPSPLPIPSVGIWGLSRHGDGTCGSRGVTFQASRDEGLAATRTSGPTSLGERPGPRSGRSPRRTPLRH